MRSGVDHTVLPANHTTPAFTRSVRQGRHDWINSYSTSWWSLLLIYRHREDEGLSWPCWLTYSGRFTHINGYQSAAGQVQASESSPVRDRRSTTEPPNQPLILHVWHVTVRCSRGATCWWLSWSSRPARTRRQTLFRWWQAPSSRSSTRSSASSSSSIRVSFQSTRVARNSVCIFATVSSTISWIPSLLHTTCDCHLQLRVKFSCELNERLNRMSIVLIHLWNSVCLFVRTIKPLFSVLWLRLFLVDFYTFCTSSNSNSTIYLFNGLMTS